MDIGTDVNFGALTRALVNHLQSLHNVVLQNSHEIRDIDRDDDDRTWKIRVKDVRSGEKSWVNARFVFIGAGGGSLTLLEKADIPEADGYGGFPVSGQWLVCNDPVIAGKHSAKVYGKASVGAPPMSVPHLDTRVIDGKKALLFGPYAGFSTRFLKHGSLMDLPLSLTWSNILPMISAGVQNIPLTKYLIDQVSQSDKERMEALRQFMPTAKEEDWKLAVAGQRVQVIKKDEKGSGVLEFGTEVVTSADCTIAALLGASPGASTSVSIMLEIIQRCFSDAAYIGKLKEMIPTYGKHLGNDASLVSETRAMTSAVLGLSAAQSSMLQ
jgi:malate dehydrogenase (quinone)